MPLQRSSRYTCCSFRGASLRSDSTSDFCTGHRTVRRAAPRPFAVSSGCSPPPPPSLDHEPHKHQSMSEWAMNSSKTWTKKAQGCKSALISRLPASVTCFCFQGIIQSSEFRAFPSESCRGRDLWSNNQTCLAAEPRLFNYSLNLVTE